jgi:hypothetical protein
MACMLTPRNFVAATILIAVVSLVAACISLMQPPDSGGSGSDSYGTRFHGQRGAFEVLAELGVPVERGLAPPTVILDRNLTLVLWKPHPELVQAEPAYLAAVAEWIKGGGRAVVAPARPDRLQRQRIEFLERGDEPERTVLGELGLSQVSLKVLDLAVSTPDGPDDPMAAKTGDVGGAGSKNSERRQAKDEFTVIRDLISGKIESNSTATVAVKGLGEFSRFAEIVTTIEVPDRGLQVLDMGSSEPAGRLTIEDREGREQTLAAVFHPGQGELIIVAEPAIAENRLLAREDNSVLAAELLAGPGRRVIFDEFYHGLTIRGNPLWLFNQRGYGATMLCLLAVMGLWIWRQAVFLGPPLEQIGQSRRSIGEYVEAMARFLSRGKSSQAFLLGEVRKGVLHSVRTELRLPPGRENVGDLAAALVHRDPRRARQLVEAVSLVDAALSQNRQFKERAAVELFQRISNCL